MAVSAALVFGSGANASGSHAGGHDAANIGAPGVAANVSRTMTGITSVGPTLPEAASKVSVPTGTGLMSSNAHAGLLNPAMASSPPLIQLFAFICPSFLDDAALSRLDGSTTVCVIADSKFQTSDANRPRFVDIWRTKTRIPGLFDPVFRSRDCRCVRSQRVL